MGIVLTEKAATEVKRIIADQKLEPETVLRVGVTGGGCSGFSYALGFDKNVRREGRFEVRLPRRTRRRRQEECPVSSTARRSTSTTASKKRGFTFDNPNAVKTCGCGSSFQA